MSSYSKTLYIGVTAYLEERIWQHKEKLAEGFTKKYNINRLVHYELYEDMLSAINREKELKGWMRWKKIALIEKNNPEWRDLYEEL
jgi:putative endonuclease